MTYEREPSTVDVERELVRYLAERRMTRRELLERMASIGAAAALAPIIAACAAAAGPSPSPLAAQPSAVGPTPSQAAPSSAPPPTPVPTPEKELFIYNWTDYIGPDTQAQFQKKYGIKVTYDKFADDATQQTTIHKDGKGGGYDVTYPASTDVASLASDGVIRALDLSLIPNAKNLAPEWTSPGYDPGNKYSMPNYWWTTGYAWNPDKISGDLSSWDALWDSRFKQHLAMLDDPREVFAAAAFKLGLSPNTASETDLDQMLATLQQQKPLIRKWTEDDIGDLTSGQVWITHAWSGDWYQMIADKPKTKYVVPKEGAIRGNDTMVVLSGAKHPIAAHLWIDFNLDARVSAANTNYIGYMGPNLAAQQYIDKSILGDQRLNPPADVLAKLVELAHLPPGDLDKYTQRWNTLRA